MKNKFEALKAFQSWPREWQELCAEFWAEGDAGVPVALQEGGVRFTVLTTADKLPTASQLMQAGPVRDCIDQGEMKLRATPVRRAAAKRPVLHFMRYTRDELEWIDLHLKNGYRPLETARLMDQKNPKQRTVEAWEKMVHRVKKHGLEKMLENAIDMEVKQ